MSVVKAFRSQYFSSLEMLRDAIDRCPPALWNDPEAKNRFWHVAYHALFYTHLYLQESEQSFVAWTGHRQNQQFLGPLPWPPHAEPEIGEPYTREELLDYAALCRKEVETRLSGLDLEAASGFSWIPFNKTELQMYNIRHLQHHTGQLIDRLRTRGGIQVNWVGRSPQ
jgi:hypothetical protein